MTRIKICGITSAADAEVAVEAGADALGFNFYPPSPRFILPEQAGRIIAKLPPFVVPVGVFVERSKAAIEEHVREIGLRAVQLHGEVPEYGSNWLRPWPIIRAFQVGRDFRPESLRAVAAHAFLLDGHAPGQLGGTGETFDWALARACARYGKIIVAGGLGPANVAEAIRAARPYGVDVASGVERAPGRKDPHAVRAFIAAVRQADAELGES